MGNARDRVIHHDHDRCFHARPDGEYTLSTLTFSSDGDIVFGCSSSEQPSQDSTSSSLFGSESSYSYDFMNSGSTRDDATTPRPLGVQLRGVSSEPTSPMRIMIPRATLEEKRDGSSSNSQENTPRTYPRFGRPLNLPVLDSLSSGSQAPRLLNMPSGLPSPISFDSSAVGSASAEETQTRERCYVMGPINADVDKWGEAALEAGSDPPLSCHYVLRRPPGSQCFRLTVHYGRTCPRYVGSGKRDLAEAREHGPRVTGFPANYQIYRSYAPPCQAREYTGLDAQAPEFRSRGFPASPFWTRR